jgi:hypothetical protein
LDILAARLGDAAVAIRKKLRPTSEELAGQWLLNFSIDAGVEGGKNLIQDDFVSLRPKCYYSSIL